MSGKIQIPGHDFIKYCEITLTKNVPAQSSADAKLYRLWEIVRKDLMAVKFKLQEELRG